MCACVCVLADNENTTAQYAHREAAVVLVMDNSKPTWVAVSDKGVVRSVCVSDVTGCELTGVRNIIVSFFEASFSSLGY